MPMKRFLLVLLLSTLALHGQPILRNSLNTNTLGTKLVWNPSTSFLDITGVNGGFSVISNGITVVMISPIPGGNGLPALNLEQYLQFSSTTNRLTISSTNTLLLDGVPLVTGSTTTTNTVINSTTINSTTINVTTNSFTVGKGGTLVITNAVTVLQVGPSVIVRTDSSTNLAATTIGTGLAFDGTTLYPTNIVENQLNLSANTTGNASTTKHGFAPVYPNDATKYLDGTGAYSTPAGSGGGGASVWIPNTALAYSSATNVTIDGSGSTNFVLTVTNTAFFVTPSNVPADKGTNTTFTLFFKMDSAGGHAVTYTNASFKWPGGSAFQPSTNANAVSWVSFTMSPFTNGIFMGGYGVLDSR